MAKKKKKVVRLTKVSIILSDRGARVCLEGMHTALALVRAGKFICTLCR